MADLSDFKLDRDGTATAVVVGVASLAGTVVLGPAFAFGALFGLVAGREMLRRSQYRP